MALSRPRYPALRDEDDGEFWIAFGQLQTTLAQQKLELAYVRAEINNARRKRKHVEERCKEIGLLVLSATREREVWEMQREDTNMRPAIPLHKRVAIGMYRLATSAEDRTVGNLFGLEPRFVRFPKLDQLEDHMQRFTAVTGFP
ncbi:hypothetical protein HPB47_005375 [Ixodes persulcatus]|uniref:Uncharacterized protein n=1 Tax=Ixodes persulcatus TaxID=34615 RepID=A0AC60PD64_IXOPE|nr:hypothetical protein HPB47_005375 [Ixodes persulcatus]